LAAGPREAGTVPTSRARQVVRQHLESLGFSVREEPFEFSAQALWALPLFGLGLAAFGLLEIPLLRSTDCPAWAAAAVWIAGLGILTLTCTRLLVGGPFPGFSRRRDANLVATRGQGRVSCWVVAHIDSKAQGHSMAGRLVAVWIAVLAILWLTLLTIWRLADGRPPTSLVVFGAGLAVIAGLLAARGRLRGTSPGARDNGTGILAALAAAQDVRGGPVGFILTGAEEFGLLGARHLARTAPELFRETEVINLDTLADRGPTYVVTHHPSDVPLARRLMDVLAPLGPPVVQRKLPIGILVDSVPLARVATRSVTISRLDWSVLRLMHTPRDTLEGLDAGFAESVGRAVASVIGARPPAV